MNFNMLNFRTLFVAGLSALCLTTSPFAAKDKKDAPGDFYNEVSRLNKVLSEVNRKYVEDVDPTELSDAALNGIRNMTRIPDAIFVVDTNRESIAIREARNLNIPVVGLLDTNCDPDDVDYGIPSNDDAIRSVRLMTEFIADAVVAGTGVPVTAEEMAGEAPAEETAEAPAETPAE